MKKETLLEARVFVSVSGNCHCGNSCDFIMHAQGATPDKYVAYCYLDPKFRQILTLDPRRKNHPYKRTPRCRRITEE